MSSYTYIPMPVLNVGPPAFSFDSLFSQLPGEVASPAYPAYPSYSVHPNYATPRPMVQHETVQHTNPVRRRSSATYHPYHIGLHETTRSPTRSRFPVPPPIPISNIDVSTALISPTRRHRHSAVLTHDRFNRGKGRRVPSEAEVESLSHLAHTQSIPKKGPTNHILIPQGLFKEPKCSQPFFFRHAPITFKMKEFPESGIKVRDILTPSTPLLEGNDDFVLKDIKEREFRVQILWPGYKPFEKRIKTHGGEGQMRTRGYVAFRLVNMVLDYRCHIKERKWAIEEDQKQWKVSNGPKDSGIVVEDLFITQMVHCGGSHWQCELWAPKLKTDML